MRTWFGTERARTWAFALGCYALLLGIYALVAGTERLVEHTPYNHFALQAEAWLNGRLDLGKPPPDYAQNNDFAHYRGKWFIPFPSLPALLIAPLVFFAGSAERVRDGQFFLWLAPLGPTLLFFALERLRQLGRSGRARWENLALSLSLGLGSVYFFTAVQGSVWFAAHVVAAIFAAGYVLCALEARRPWLAGLLLGLGFWSRASLLFGEALFLFEAWAACRRAAAPGAVEAGAHGLRAAWRRAASAYRATDVPRFLKLSAQFALPVALLFGLSLLHNYARFDDPFDVGYRYLKVAWQGRIERWGLFHYHYLAKNLGVVLTGLPWIQPFRINVHGLALWLTTPVYLYLLWPKRPAQGYAALLVTAAAVSLPPLFYQNTGWMQFGYRFSNDYAVFLFVALALTGRRFGVGFWLLTAWAVAVNSFGAVTFDRPSYAHLYYQQPSQNTLYQPD
jgi:hypothetical protein